MLTLDAQLMLAHKWPCTVTHLAQDAIHVSVHIEQTLFTFRLLPDSSNGIRLEQFQPEDVEPASLLNLSTALQSLLTGLNWQYVVGLYPLAWQNTFENLGFQYLKERIRWEIQLEPDQPVRPILPEAIHIKPLTSSAEELGKLLFAAEHNSSLSVGLCTTFCQELLKGTYGPLIARACGEIFIDEEPAGACLFTDYFGEALVGHIFLVHTRQGHGYASMLLQHCLDGLRKAGYPRAISSVDATNTASQQLHARTGFTEVHPGLSCSLLTRANWRNGEAL